MAEHSEQQLENETSELTEADPLVSDFEPVISAVAPDGTARSRREMRQLREEAIAAHAAEILAQTQALALDELAEIEGAAAIEDDAEVASESESEQEAAEVAGPEADADDPAVASAASEASEEVPDADYADADGPDADDADDATERDDAEDDAGGVSEAGAEESAEAEDDEAEAFAAKPATTSGYSFPDIAPLEEGMSVFDDPNSPTAIRAAEPAEPSDFDDFITAAIAQEGSGSSSGTSALILPNLDHTGQLTGPLGETGELFITGSIELPKSLGETGGHARLFDSVDEDGEDAPAASLDAHDADDALAPVSAANAVSARSVGSLVASPEKEKSKLPAVLIGTGGGLLAVIVGLGIWAVSTGFFG